MIHFDHYFSAGHRFCAAMAKEPVAPDGKFTVTNERNGFSRTYAAR
jgi:hypothetical protein